VEERKFTSLEFLRKAQRLGVEKVMFMAIGLFEYVAE
jgi:hypothetical protein